MRKKGAAILLAVLLCLSMTACSLVSDISKALGLSEESPESSSGASSDASQSSATTAGTSVTSATGENDVRIGTVVADGGLRLREGPGTSYKQILLIPNYSTVTVTRTNGDWLYVSYDDAKGWVSGEFVVFGEVESSATTTTAEVSVVKPAEEYDEGKPMTVKVEDGLRMRAGPGTEYPKILLIPSGAAVVEYGRQAGWAYVGYAGARGWVSGEFLEPGSSSAP